MSPAEKLPSDARGRAPTQAQASQAPSGPAQFHRPRDRQPRCNSGRPHYRPSPNPLPAWMPCPPHHATSARAPSTVALVAAAAREEGRLRHVRASPSCVAYFECWCVVSPCTQGALRALTMLHGGLHVPVDAAFFSHFVSTHRSASSPRPSSSSRSLMRSFFSACLSHRGSGRRRSSWAQRMRAFAVIRRCLSRGVGAPSGDGVISDRTRAASLRVHAPPPSSPPPRPSPPSLLACRHAQTSVDSVVGPARQLVVRWPWSCTVLGEQLT